MLTSTGPTWKAPTVAEVLRSLPFLRHTFRHIIQVPSPKPPTLDPEPRPHPRPQYCSHEPIFFNCALHCSVLLAHALIHAPAPVLAVQG